MSKQKKPAPDTAEYTRNGINFGFAAGFGVATMLFWFLRALGL